MTPPPCPDPGTGAQARDYALGGLSAADEARFEDHLAGCADCAQQVLVHTRVLDALVDDVSGVSAPPGAAEANPAARWWGALARRVLSPAAALVYVLLLVALVPATLLRTGDLPPGRSGGPGSPSASATASGPPAVDVPTVGPGGPGTASPATGVHPVGAGEVARVLPPAVRIFGEETTRGGSPEMHGGSGLSDGSSREPTGTPRDSPGAGPPALPLEIDLPAGREEIVLDVRTEIPEEDLGDPSAAFVIELRDDERSVWSVRKRGSDFERGGGIRLALSSDRLSPDVLYSLAIRLEKPGDPLDGETVFRKSFRVRASKGDLSNQRQSPAATKPAHR